MQNVGFALPTLATSGMSTNDQNTLLVNQATALIVSSYLEHMSAAIAAGVTTSAGVSPNAFINPTELGTLIDTVQSALLS